MLADDDRRRPIAAIVRAGPTGALRVRARPSHKFKLAPAAAAGGVTSEARRRAASRLPPLPRLRRRFTGVKRRRGPHEPEAPRATGRTIWRAGPKSHNKSARESEPARNASRKKSADAKKRRFAAPTRPVTPAMKIPILRESFPVRSPAPGATKKKKPNEPEVTGGGAAASCAAAPPPRG